jgi:hypothetical protein
MTGFLIFAGSIASVAVASFVIAGILQEGSVGFHRYDFRQYRNVNFSHPFRWVFISVLPIE